MTNATLPKTVKVGAVNYEINIVPNFREDHNLYGQCVYADARISIAGNLPYGRTLQTFFHELTHAIINEASEHEINENEAFIERFSNVLTQVAVDNGWLTKGVLGNAGTFDDTAGFYEDALREIDMHIRSTPEPVPYIIETLKRTLPEYNDCGGDRE